MANTTHETTPQVQFANAEAVDISSTDHQFAHPSALYVGGSGIVIVDMAGNGSSVTLNAAVAGQVLPIFVHKVKKAGTTATSMVGLN